MNNLLQSLSVHRLKVHVAEGDLKRLLNTVKDNRGHDSKLSDAFYDSLEGVLQDLRAVTLDNRDAEAFLKPVSKIDYPDYYEIIKEPMDLQTMGKKVKQKQYKSKAEFADDLELIWSNCYTYNTGDNHPLRQCVNRLRVKANKLLRNLTDRRDRLDPQLPGDLSSGFAPTRPNGVMVNGHSRQRSSTPLVKTKADLLNKSSSLASSNPAANRQGHSFTDKPAFVRTPSGMSQFFDLDRDLENIAGPSNLDMGFSNATSAVAEKLFRLIEDNESDDEGFVMETVNGDVGEKRKLVMNGDTRPRKRQRNRSRERRSPQNSNPVELWWDATTSSTLMANGLPTLTYSSSFACEAPYFPPSSSTSLASKSDPKAQSVKKRRKKRPPEGQSRPQPRSLLGLINNNVRSLKRVRRVHDKFLLLNLDKGNAEDGAGGGLSVFGSVEPLEPVRIQGSNVALDEDDADALDVILDNQPWRSRGTGLEIGEEDANDCLHWMGTKVLEHSGFQCTSKAALDVFTGVAEEYLFNVGRTLRFMCDKYSQQMTAEEIILHTLFESGITHIRDLERYITDDVVRYGTRLNELEKKLVNAYNEVTSVDALDDEAFFNEDEEEDGELVMGNFADSFGDDFLGLRELGIAGELGLQSLTIPKKLLKGKGKRRDAEDTKPKEPPPPYPPPPPFVPLESGQVDSQIGLLKNFYVRRFNEQAQRAAPGLPLPFIQGPSQPRQLPLPPRALSPTSILEMQLLAQDMEQDQPPESSVPGPEARIPVPNPAAPPVALPDDPPNPARTKIGPLGQILRPSASSSAAKKKAQAKPKDIGGHGYLPDLPPGSGPLVLAPSGAGSRGMPMEGVTPVSGPSTPAGQQSKKTPSPKKKPPDTPMPPAIVANA